MVAVIPSTTTLFGSDGGYKLVGMGFMIGATGKGRTNVRMFHN